MNKLFLLFLIFVAALSAKEEGPLRDYYAEVRPCDKEDVAYIINTMGMGSLTKIATSRASLKKAGKRIDHLHPFNFLLTIFLDEEMKASVHAMRARTWIWDEFFSGVKGSFNEEYARGNVTQEQIDDFAHQLHISPALITPAIKKQDWNQLVKILLKTIPRNTEVDRYDM